jgi:hypothetical protein
MKFVHFIKLAINFHLTLNFFIISLLNFMYFILIYQNYSQLLINFHLFNFY